MMRCTALYNLPPSSLISESPKLIIAAVRGPHCQPDRWAQDERRDMYLQVSASRISTRTTRG